MGLRTTGEAGYALFYTLVLTPFMVSLAVLAVDIGGWLSLSERLQRDADRLALQAARALPDMTRVESIVAAGVETINIPQIRYDLRRTEFEGRTLELQLSAPYRTAFSHFLHLYTGRDNTLTASRQAAAGILPADYILILPDGHTLRPPRTAVGDVRAWGNEFEWPPAAFFSSCVLPPRPTSEGQTDPWQNFSSREFQRWATQACFNPVFSPIKLAATDLISRIRQQPQDRIAVLFSPGNVAGVNVLRELRAGKAAGNLLLPSSAGFFPSRGRDTVWEPSREDDLFLGDEACVLFDSVDDPNYSLRHTSHQDECASPLAVTPCGQSFDPLRSDLLRPCFFERNLSLEEAIYWRAAREARNGFPAVFDLMRALRQALIEFEDVTDFAFTVEQTVRGNAALVAERRVIVVTDYLASPSAELQEALAKLIAPHGAALRAHVDLVALAHHYLPPSLRASLIENARDLGALEQAEPFSGYLRVFVVEHPQELRQTVLPSLAGFGRSIILRR